ncbi:protein RGF1 INDUCIBLE TRANSCRIPTION FACTOR 1-like [Corylus avellana]|uniref:protein RGF1 INDUCIBLE TRANSCRIPTION FACTOR 1-like n=1 Tax=Corylus avellana TaxID=13451 RepID=UPI00286C335E|nr:protein RGF1 INDUCIBLE TRANSCRIPTION FACTOR 1-like [Corylus avellana]
MGIKEDGASSSIFPHWLQILLGEKFFNPCITHEFAKKNEKNIFCMECCISICPHCLPSHHPHPLLQIRRYVYHDVMRLRDAQQVMNCSLVQPYTTNSAKVVFLNQRPMSHGSLRCSGRVCVKCDRFLQDPFLYCSLSCKVHHQLETANSGGNCELPILPEKPRSKSLSEIEEDDHDHDQTTRDSVLDSNSGSASARAMRDKTVACSTVTKEFAKMKRGSLNSVPRGSYRLRCSPESEIALALNRRKGVPHRSPLN